MGLAFVGYRNNMAKKINYHTIGELFCGPGGMGYGAKLASNNHKNIKIEH